METLENVKRFEVIDNSGRAYTCYDLSLLRYEFQDNGETFKIFINATGKEI